MGMGLTTYVSIAELARRRLRWVVAEEAGQSMIEYGLLAALIAVVVIAAVTLLGGNLRNVFNNIANNL
jgi:pilus assembly protein Flp/PilA